MSGEINKHYIEMLKSLKEKIRQARQRTILSVNKETLKIYWEIGNIILIQQKQEGWGAKIIDKLAADLMSEFPDMKGFSVRNIKYMRAFAEAFPNFVQQAAAPLQNDENQSITIVQQLAAQLPWGHHQLLLDKIKNKKEHIFYIKKTIENGWSRNVLLHQIESGLYKAQGSLINNFPNTIPAYQSELTQQVFKDPYNFDFIMLGERAKEKDLENALMTHLTKVLLELGAGFAFMGRQRKFEAGGREFYIDLLFYHTKLRRHIIIELKIGEFEPEFVSKMNLYLGLADDQLKGEQDEAAIGLILCKTNNKIVAEYALRDTSKPIGIAEYKIAARLPENIKGELPSIEEIEQRVDEELKEEQTTLDRRLQAVKEKIRNIQADEIQSPVTFSALNELYDKGLRFLFIELINRVNLFEEDFLQQKVYWYCTNKTFTNIEEVNRFWEQPDEVNNISEFNFHISLDGFKKAGTEHWNISKTLVFKIDKYYYSFYLINYNNQQPFLKKLYHQPLSNKDQQLIIDIIINEVLNDIEIFLERIGK